MAKTTNRPATPDCSQLLLQAAEAAQEQVHQTRLGYELELTVWAQDSPSGHCNHDFHVSNTLSRAVEAAEEPSFTAVYVHRTYVYSTIDKGKHISINQSIQYKVCLGSSTDPSDCIVGIMIRLLTVSAG